MKIRDKFWAIPNIVLDTQKLEATISIHKLNIRFMYTFIKTYKLFLNLIWNLENL